MLAELIRQDYSFPFGEARIRLRYSLADFLELEKRDLFYMDIFAEELSYVVIMTFFKVGLVDKLPDKTIEEIIECAGITNIWDDCRAAMRRSIPEKDPLIIPDLSGDKQGEFSFVRLRTLIVDIMRKSEEFFWNSTLAELISRWQEYAYAMGYAKPPEKVQMRDTEGM